MSSIYSLDPQELYQKILDGQIRRFPPNYWKQSGVEEVASEITRYFIEKILKWNEKDIKEKTSELIFRKYKLSGMLEGVFDRSPFKAINNAYPNKFKAFEFNCVPRGYWANMDNIEEALNYLLIKSGKNKYNELTNKDFLKFNLGGLLDYISRYNLHSQINADKIERDKTLKEICVKVSFSITNTKSNRNKVNARIELPVSMLSSIGINQLNNEVTVSIKNDSIMIKKK